MLVLGAREVYEESMGLTGCFSSQESQGGISQTMQVNQEAPLGTGLGVPGAQTRGSRAAGRGWWQGAAGLCSEWGRGGDEICVCAGGPGDSQPVLVAKAGLTQLC